MSIKRVTVSKGKVNSDRMAYKEIKEDVSD